MSVEAYYQVCFGEGLRFEWDSGPGPVVIKLCRGQDTLHRFDRAELMKLEGVLVEVLHHEATKR